MEKNNVLVQNLYKNFDDFSLKDVSFCIPKGRIVGFIGENGAGKSTTINLILNELKKDAGKIEIFGVDNATYSIKNDIGIVFDECNFHDIFTVKHISKILSGIYTSWDDTLYQHYLEKFKLPLKKTIGSFSKGMKMKLSIICAMAHRPKLLILDEATTGLDPVSRDEILDLFLEFIQDEEHSIFFSSHITSDIQKIADYVILIHKGEIIFEEQKDNLIYNYGIIRCGKEKFKTISQDDYLICKQTNMSIECLVDDKETARRKYKDVVVDNATLEDIMLFYIKGGILCED
ncbi:ABC transporter ATP-binding protein [Clostridioides difficile]|nr:ABC transporter [Clostridioides difficile]MCI9977835.1 ABC transporter ATP-binding protein [Clostridioides difficile]MDI0268176.1 ABC transporter ATP-binding protein [Clostridioides difficile]NJI82596.1 ABC transporter ATP-binding protein [Clostridioides difficile]NJJ36579.1 ABC transporter ATP-binding protein [Clostridioides difficile]